MATYENGDVEKDIRRDTIADNDNTDQGEYGNLVRYISTYRDGRRGSTASGGGADPHEKKKGFFSRKKKDEASGVFETPDEWLTTDMKAGLRTSDVETRRKKTGWNELTTEKENLFLKFIGFFKGPILYGMFDSSIPFIFNPPHHHHIQSIAHSSSLSSSSTTNHVVRLFVWMVLCACLSIAFSRGSKAIEIEIAGSTQKHTFQTNLSPHHSSESNHKQTPKTVGLLQSLLKLAPSLYPPPNFT